MVYADCFDYQTQEGHVFGGLHKHRKGMNTKRRNEVT